MAYSTVRHEVILALALTKDQIHDADMALALGADEEKVEAAGELRFLLRRKALLETRLAEVDRRIAEHRTLFSWFRQEWFNLKLHVESWIAHG
jgi:hypothetical protein